MPHVHAGTVPDLLNTGLLLSNIYQINVIHVCLLNIIEMLIAISMHICFHLLKKMKAKIVTVDNLNTTSNKNGIEKTAI